MKRALLVSTTLLLVCFCAQAQTAPDDGEMKQARYFNYFFNVSYTPPKEWVIHDEAMKQRIKERAKEEALKDGSLPQLKQTYALLIVTRYPRPTPDVAVNSTIIVAAEKLIHPTAKDYLLSIRRSKSEQGVRNVRDELLQFRIAGFDFLRDDYSGEVSGVAIKESIFVSARKGYALIFSFTSGDRTTVDEMVETMQSILPLGDVKTGP